MVLFLFVFSFLNLLKLWTITQYTRNVRQCTWNICGFTKMNRSPATPPAIDKTLSAVRRAPVWPSDHSFCLLVPLLPFLQCDYLSVHPSTIVSPVLDFTQVEAQYILCCVASVAQLSLGPETHPACCGELFFIFTVMQDSTAWLFYSLLKPLRNTGCSKFWLLQSIGCLDCFSYDMPVKSFNFCYFLKPTDFFLTNVGYLQIFLCTCCLETSFLILRLLSPVISKLSGTEF